MLYDLSASTDQACIRRGLTHYVQPTLTTLIRTWTCAPLVSMHARALCKTSGCKTTTLTITDSVRYVNDSLLSLQQQSKSASDLCQGELEYGKRVSAAWAAGAAWARLRRRSAGSASARLHRRSAGAAWARLRRRSTGAASARLHRRSAARLADEAIEAGPPWPDDAQASGR